jgi:hypothetical protein
MSKEIVSLFEKKHQKIERAFRNVVRQISAIESNLGLADVSQFTAPPPPKS